MIRTHVRTYAGTLLHTPHLHMYILIIFKIVFLLLFYCLSKYCFWMFAFLVRSLTLVSSVVQGSAVNGSIAYNASTGEVSGWTLLKGTYDVLWCMVCNVCTHWQQGNIFNLARRTGVPVCSCTLYPSCITWNRHFNWPQWTWHCCVLCCNL